MNISLEKNQKGKHAISQSNSTWSFNKYLLGPYYVPRNILWAKDKAIKKKKVKNSTLIPKTQIHESKNWMKLDFIKI